MPRRHLMTALLCCAAPCTLPSLCHAQDAALDDAVLRGKLLRLPRDGIRETIVSFPTGPTSWSSFRVRDSRTVPYALGARYPGMRSFRGEDDQGRTLRLDLSTTGVRASVRDGASEWVIRPGRPGVMERSVPRPARPPFLPGTGAVASIPARRTSASGGTVRYDFRLAVAASSRFAAAFGGTVEGALAEVVHMVNRANEVFETDVGVHFTLVPRNDRLIRADPKRDPYETHDPGPATVDLIERIIGGGRYDIGHAVTTWFGGESNVATSCSDARDADFDATHKAAAWSGHADPAGESYATGFLIHVLGRQLGAWPTANGCGRFTLEDRAVEPGGGSTAMGFAPSRCGGAGQWLQLRSDLYFHAASLDQMHTWLSSRGGSCAAKRISPVAAPWIDPEPLAEEHVVPARTPFYLDATVEAPSPGQRLTYAWEQMDVGGEQKQELSGAADGPLFRSFPPSASTRRVFPRWAAILGDEPSGPGEVLPTVSRPLRFRLTVRDNGGADATVASAEARVRVLDTGRPFAVLAPEAGATARAGAPLAVRWDIADTAQAPIHCYFVNIDLSLDGGATWRDELLSTDESNDGEAVVTLPNDAATERARVRVGCDGRPFFAVSPGDFPITP